MPQTITNAATSKLLATIELERLERDVLDAIESEAKGLRDFIADEKCEVVEALRRALRIHPEGRAELVAKCRAAWADSLQMLRSALVEGE
jgi:hypothetical protein